MLLLAAHPAVADEERERPWPEEWPIELPPVEGPLPPPPPARPMASPATRAGERVLRELAEIERTLVRTRYQHRIAVNRRRGTYYWDCSLMVHWVLRRAAPRSVRHLRDVDRALAAHFVRAIERAPEDGYRRGWQRIGHIRDVRPGDVFAWRRPEGFPSRNTGHVGFVLRQPQPVPGLPNGWVVRVADATRSFHQNDARAAGAGDGGFGVGTLAFLTDGEGRGTHYGWHGTYSQGYVVTPILFGRVGP